jgi:hypothetical protein
MLVVQVIGDDWTISSPRRLEVTCTVMTFCEVASKHQPANTPAWSETPSKRVFTRLEDLAVFTQRITNAPLLERSRTSVVETQPIASGEP